MTKKEVNQVAYAIVGCAIEVHKQVGPGLLESVYEICLVQELKVKGFQIVRQLSVPITYKGVRLDAELRLDLLVNDCVVVELKAVENLIPLYEAQLLTYMKLLQKPKGLLINFHTENITKSIKPMVNEFFSILP
ncbi:GxxExxY protein [Runella sp. MFBS21]|uniref:GxxExxY protein n=1 Tax=Runella sp. MFBS21 TaxID=3034018 RepID=UPI0023F99ACB|nr:GxxExxY protein [Runella sp. MFBS21]MDF7818863.1 GxxExxY protein [Runella sp. MFBS21]